MARLCLPGLPVYKSPLVPRFKTQPPFQSFPIPPVARFVFRRNYEVPSHSFAPSPVSIPRAGVRSFKPASGVRSFAQMRIGSRLPVPVRKSTPSTVPPAPAPTGAGRSLNPSVSRLEERRAARQARSRPWVSPKSQSQTESREGHLSMSRPSPSNPPRRSLRPALHRPVAVSSQAQRAIGLIDAVLAKPAPASAGVGGRKAKSVKSVRFGETTVVTVSRWIDRRENVFPAPLAAMGHLQGWKVTPLSKPDEDGETEKYTTYWGSDSYIMLTSSHSASESCGRYGCAWNRLARIAGLKPTWGPATVFMAWNRLREQIRQRGGYRLSGWRISCCGIGGA
ncbi:uncharacterized protein BO80DRAFT_409916 [Aspergillus ibericus CBS 121593]|uniref:Uncharacterized protein n=1 Tax=Aspergillus ibericus CBS 121593 TaxID=1448316 RepID=A0A395GVQ9_9EURO|nr:hypothetical protein BO80DRAFT_409916 [Aspergillus ibericus CBS 121593]RAK99661.1 hypothetical protein BO80DRAFT_409916 [Aspergillus ibericus CBS 121593]